MNRNWAKPSTLMTSKASRPARVRRTLDGRRIPDGTPPLLWHDLVHPSPVAFLVSGWRAPSHPSRKHDVKLSTCTVTAPADVDSYTGPVRRRDRRLQARSA